MKQFLLNFLASLAALVVFGAGVYAAVYFLWWTKPLGEPMHLLRALNPDYEAYWSYIKLFGGLAILEGAALIGLLCAVVCKLYRR